MRRGLARSHLYRLIRRILRPPRFEDMVSQYFDSQTPNVPDELIARQSREQLMQARDTCRKAGAELLVIPRLSTGAFLRARAMGMHSDNLKWRWELFGDNSSYLLYRPCQQEGIPVFNASDAFLEAFYTKNLFADECHFTAEGHAFMAKVLADYLCESDLLSAKCEAGPQEK